MDISLSLYFIAYCLVWHDRHTKSGMTDIPSLALPIYYNRIVKHLESHFAFDCIRSNNVYLYLQLLRDESTIVLGLSVLQIMSEEFISPREDLNTVRKQELRTLLLEQAEGTLSRVMAILDAVMQKSRNTTNTSTPPPSPNRHSPFTSPSSSPSHNGSSSPFHGATGASQKSWLPSNSLHQDKLITAPTLDVASEEIVIAALGCLNQFFTWMPLSRVLSPVLISKFFLFAAYGCSGLSNGASDHKSNDIGQLIFLPFGFCFFPNE